MHNNEFKLSIFISFNLCKEEHQLWIMIIFNLSFVKLASVTFQKADGPLVVHQYTNIVMSDHKLKPTNS